MRKIFIALIFFCMTSLPLNGSAENIPLPGEITMHDIDGKPVQGVQVVAADVSNPTISDTFGLFELIIAGKNPGDAVTLKVLKEGLEVVNRMDMEVILRAEPDKRVKIVLCAEGERDSYALTYYKIRVERAIQENYEELKSLLTGKDAELAQLREERDTAFAQAEEVAKKFAELTLEEASGLYKQAFRVFQEGEIDAAIAVLDEAKIAAALQKARAEIKKGVDSYVLKARLYVIKFQFEKAEALYQKAIDTDPENFENLFEFARYLQKQNQFLKARPLYEQALSLAKDDSDVAVTLNNLGMSYQALNQYPEARAALQRALTIREELAQTNPQTYLPDVAATLNNLGKLYQELNQYPEATAVYQRGLTMYEELAQTNPQTYLPGVAITLNNLGVLYWDLNQYPEVTAALQRALTIREELAQTNPQTYLPDVADTLNNLGILYWDLNHYPEATAAYQRALTIREELAQTNPQTYLPGVAMTLNNLGMLYQELNQYPEARAAYQRALTIREELAQTNPQTYLPDVAATLNNLGMLYSDLNQYPEATAVYQRGLTIYEELAQTNPQTYLPGVAITLNNLGVLYQALNQYPEATAAYQRALTIREELAQTNPQTYLPDVATTLYNLGILHKTRSQYTEALTTLQRSLDIQEQFAKDNPRAYDLKVCGILIHLSDLYAKLFDKAPKQSYKEQGLSFAERAITILQKYPDIQMAQSYMEVAVYCKEYFENLAIEFNKD